MSNEEPSMNIENSMSDSEFRSQLDRLFQVTWTSRLEQC